MFSLYIQHSLYTFAISILLVSDTTLLELQATSVMLVKSGLRVRTRRTYSSAQKSYLEFCDQFNVLSLPCTEDTILLYLSYLYKKGYTGNTIRVYISAVRSLHVEEGYGNPIQGFLRLKQALI